MKRTLFALVLPAFAFARFAVDFESVPEGLYDQRRCALDFPGLEQVEGLKEGRGKIVAAPDGGKALEITFPEGGVGPAEGGVNFVAGLPGAEERTLRFTWTFAEGFDFSRGGKLPGLAGGTAPSGGADPRGGFSARIMWCEKGALKLYLYHRDQPGKYGSYFDLAAAATPGVPLRFALRVKLNTPGEPNGVVEISINGERKFLGEDFVFRAAGETWRVEKLMHNTFYGGDDRTWAPSIETRARIDDIVVE